MIVKVSAVGLLCLVLWTGTQANIHDDRAAEITQLEEDYNLLEVYYNSQLANYNHRKAELALLQDEFGDPSQNPTPGKRVAFSAALSTTINYPSANTPIIFDRVFQNVGNGYDSTTGIFTCPTTGVYMFTVNLVSLTGYKAYASLRHNGQNKFWTFAGRNPLDLESATNSGIVECFAGDPVNVVTAVANSRVHGNTNYWTTFTGSKLYSTADPIP